jgi:hypothetical protein
MELNSKAVLSVLKSKGITEFHHANSVQTSCIFLQQGRLLSRGTVDERGIKQTPQSSDEVDRRYGIWYDLFLDAVDIHKQMNSRNFYGPVMFVFDIDLLLEDWLPTIWVTKKNPVKWTASDTPADRYFQSIDEFKNGYHPGQKGSLGTMFMLRNAGGVLRLDPYLKEIVVDDPGREIEDANAYSLTVGALRASACQGGLTNISIRKRVCSSNCKCASNYKTLGHKSVKQFFLLNTEN